MFHYHRLRVILLSYLYYFIHSLFFHIVTLADASHVNAWSDFSAYPALGVSTSAPSFPAVGSSSSFPVSDAPFALGATTSSFNGCDECVKLRFSVKCLKEELDSARVERFVTNGLFCLSYKTIQCYLLLLSVSVSVSVAPSLCDVEYSLIPLSILGKTSRTWKRRFSTQTFSSANSTRSKKKAKQTKRR